VVKRFSHTGIADGSTFEEEWTADLDYTLRHILVKRTDGKGFTKTDITIRINEVPLTRPSCLVNTLGTDKLNALDWAEDLPKTAKIDYSGTNREGVTIDISVELVLDVR